VALAFGLTALAEKPHVVLFVADDMGWGDVSCRGSVIETPNIGGLAKRGVLLYDIEADPNETTDLKTDYPDVVARLKAQIEVYRKESARPHGSQSQANSSIPDGFTLPKVWGPWLD
jgi:arylsulfatase A-like enzyme